MNNIRNVLVSKDQLERLINKYLSTPIRIKNIKKFQKAFMHKSFLLVDDYNSDSDNHSVLDSAHNLSNNERLEFLGDKVIDLITTEFLFDSFPKKNEGFLTKLKSRIVKKEGLAFLGNCLGFKKWLLMSSHLERSSGRDNIRFLEDVFESFMGALYKDQNSDLNVCRSFLVGVYTEFVDLGELIRNNDNYKEKLLQTFHTRGWGHPVYDTLYATPQTGFTSVVWIPKGSIKLSAVPCLARTVAADKPDKSDSVLLRIEDMIRKGHMVLGIGKGMTKKQSEQECSKYCLVNL